MLAGCAVLVSMAGCSADGGSAADPATDAAEEAGDPGPVDADAGDGSGADPGAPDVGDAEDEGQGDAGEEAGGDADVPPPVEGPGAAGALASTHADTVPIPGGGEREVVATVCTPSPDGGVTTGAGPFPLVVLSPGFGTDKSSYDSYCRHLASWGFVVVLQNYSESSFKMVHAHLAEDVSRIIDWVASPQSGLADRLDVERVATAGHSLGGKVSLLAATIDPRVKAVVGWDPVVGGAPGSEPDPAPVVDVPLVVLGETTDAVPGPYGQACAPAGQNFQAVFEAAKPPAIQVTVAGANHMAWVDDPDCGLPCLVCNEGTSDPAWVRMLTRRTTVAFLRRHLLGDAEMDAFLTGEAMQADEAAGRVRVATKP